MIRKRIRHGYEFRLMYKKKGAHLKRPQIHFGFIFRGNKEYQSLSDTDVVEIRDWLSRYINTHTLKTSKSELCKTSRSLLNQTLKNINKLESAPECET